MQLLDFRWTISGRYDKDLTGF